MSEMTWAEMDRRERDRQAKRREVVARLSNVLSKEFTLTELRLVQNDLGNAISIEAFEIATYESEVMNEWHPKDRSRSQRLPRPRRNRRGPIRHRRASRARGDWSPPGTDRRRVVGPPPIIYGRSLDHHSKGLSRGRMRGGDVSSPAAIGRSISRAASDDPAPRFSHQTLKGSPSRQGQGGPSPRHRPPDPRLGSA